MPENKVWVGLYHGDGYEYVLVHDPSMPKSCWRWKLAEFNQEDGDPDYTHSIHTGWDENCGEPESYRFDRILFAYYPVSQEGSLRFFREDELKTNCTTLTGPDRLAYYTEYLRFMTHYLKRDHRFPYVSPPEPFSVEGARIFIQEAAAVSNLVESELHISGFYDDDR